MTADVVQFTPEHIAIYLGGELQHEGYESSDWHYINGLIDGCIISGIHIDRIDHVLSEEGTDEFLDNGSEVPKSWPNSKWSKYVLK